MSHNIHHVCMKTRLYQYLDTFDALGLWVGTRFFSVSLSVLSVVAIASVYWPEAWHTWGELEQGYVLRARL